MARLGTVTLSIDDVRVGAMSSHPIKDERGLLLLGASTRITPGLLAGLRDRGIESIEIDPRDEVQMRSGGLRRRTPTRFVPRGLGQQREWRTAEPLKLLLVDRHAEMLNHERNEQLVMVIDCARTAFEGLNPNNGQLDSNAMEITSELSNTYARSLVDDCDQTVGAVVNTAIYHEQLADRSTQLSVLSMAVGVEMGFDGPQTIQLGIAGLLHDIALFSLGSEFINPVGPFDQQDLWEYHKHPLASTQCIAKVVEFSQSIELAIEQVHEQFDGSGYPRGLSGRRIHPYARILNVVDTYLQLTRPSYHRPAIVPHDALGYILHQSAHGIFDPKVVRAFLNTNTMFPLGSDFELDNGQIATVIRRPRVGYSRPVLAGDDGQRYDLEHGTAQIVRPAIRPGQEQMRLSVSMMQSGCGADGAPLLAL